MNYDDLIRYLRDLGHRLTPQRRLMLEILQQSDYHLSADDIAQQLAVRYPSIQIDMATVYRTLKWLRAAGLVCETSLGKGRMVYTLTAHHQHHHLVCENCAATFEIDPTIFDTIRVELQRRYGFAARLEHLSVFGLCQQCQQLAGSAPALVSEGAGDGVRYDQ
jgi:Fur family ferric uptake transcriptional regulator